MIADSDQLHRVVPNGKFLSRHGHKFFLKAMRVGGTGDAFDFGEKLAMRKRFDELRAANTTGLIICSGEAEQLLGLAAQAGLCALVEIAIRPEALFSRASLAEASSRLSTAVRRLRAEPGLIGYLLDCPLEPSQLRHYGLERLQKRVGRLLAAVRATDQLALVAVKHRPGTVGLATRDEDLIYAVLPPLPPGELRSYALGLHNLAEARPVVLEFGPRLPAQDEVVACAFGLGAAGVVAAPIAGRPSAGGQNQLAVKLLTGGELLPFVTLNGSCPPEPAQAPMISVVICAYNAARTLCRCLDSLRVLDYPHFEVVIVDDGSRDATAQIAAAFPEFRLIRQANKGLSVARNVGLHAARGELVAYTDSDCIVDPHWLSLMARALLEGGFDGCGGPNYAPQEPGWVQGCVAAAPGAPCHVLTADDRAEHLVGCNMLYRKAALLAIGGFDARFTAAGDDVDICWRLLEAGFTLGYCPAAFVWHFRRNTIKAYYGQQRGYGKAEALLYRKYPERFNALGQIRWQGTIPGLARTVPGGGRRRIRWARRSGQLQGIYEMPLTVPRMAPLTAEWNLAAVTGLVLSLAFGLTILPTLAAMVAGPIWALHYALQAPLEKRHRGVLARLLIAWLAYSGPIVRAVTRCRYHHRTPGRPLFEIPARQHPAIDWFSRRLRLSYWNDTYSTRERMLERLGRFFMSLDCPVIIDDGWKDYDLVVEPDRWTRIEFKSADEELGGMKIRTNIAARLRLRAGVLIGLSACVTAVVAAAAVGAAMATTLLGAVTSGIAAFALGDLIKGGRLAYGALEQCGNELRWVPLGRPRAATGRVPAQPMIGAKAGNTAEVQPANR